MIGFAAFLRCVRGADVKPYPWQTRLAARCAVGEPPELIAVPTGAGKTTTIDALVWALACQADRAAAERTVGVRIVWAIDRRILVDEVHEHARELADLLSIALRDHADPLHEMAVRLAQLSGGEPLVATRWRGGLDARPERQGPLQPQVITSTVAQIGSHLLFRGYGVASGSLALEAGQAACDTTICLDEAHLAQPFRETVAAICRHREASERTVRLPGLRAITLTATPPRDEQADVLRLNDADRVALGSRITGPKLARLVEPPSGGGEADAVALIVEQAAAYVRDGAATVACVANTVRRARAVFDALRKRLGAEADVTLLVGPQRSADRQGVLEAHSATLFEGTPAEKPLVCVATQTFEVGLDADVAAMVTESASAAALVQRFGRLNRRGDPGVTGRATVVRDEGRWLYAHDEPAAWSWLRGLERADGTIDVSVVALEAAAPPLPARAPLTASLTPDVVDLLAQTSPRPAPWTDPDPDVFVRGVDAEPAADVAVCWRSDLRENDMDDTMSGYRSALLELVPPHPQELLTLSLTSARALLAARYPQAGTSPAASARVVSFDADVEDAMLDAPVPDPVAGAARRLPFLVLRRGELRMGALGRGTAGAESRERGPIAANQLEPGDVIVLPTRAGGVDDLGLAPLQPRTESATDVAPDLRPIGTAAPVRITPEALGGGSGTPLPLRRWERVEQACRRAERDIASAVAEPERQAAVDRLIARLEDLVPAHPGIGLLQPGAPERGERTFVLRRIGKVAADGMPMLDEAEQHGDDEEIDGERELSASMSGDVEDPSSSTIPPDALAPLTRVWVLVPAPAEADDPHGRRFSRGDRPPTIDEHAQAVCEEITRVAERLRLAPEVGRALALAGRAHDHGKADPRAQAYYRRGVEALGAVLLAKSEFGTQDPRMDKLARRLAGLPERLDHERASVAILREAVAAGRLELAELDLDLVLHLIGAHHGRGRHWPRVPVGGRDPRLFRADAAGIAGAARGDAAEGWEEGAWLQRFWRVSERYGAWGIAYLESLLTLSDRTVSSWGR